MKRFLGWTFLILAFLCFWAGAAAASLIKWYWLPLFWMLAGIMFDCFVRVAETIFPTSNEW